MLKSQNSGCNGGHVIFIQDAVISGRIQTMETEDNFPYKNIFYNAKRLSGTKFQLHSQVIPVSPAETIYLKKAEEALTYLNKHIPIFMELQMVQSTMPLSSLYRTHNLIEGPCEKAKESHVVLVVGYGKFKGQDVWVILNSWGRHYGSQGYAYIKRGSNALCGENVMYYLQPKQHDEPIYSSYPHLRNSFQIKRGIDGLDFDNGTYYGYKIHEQLVGDLFLLCQSLLIVVCFASFKCARRAAYHRNRFKRRINWLSVVE